LGKVVESDGNSIKYNYDLDNNISNVTENINGTSHSTGYTYDKDSKLKTITYNGNNVGYNYDVLGRLDTKTINTGTSSYITDFDYKAGQVANSTTTKVSKITNKDKGISYTYDANGNIETITEDGKQIKYQYNELNELKREDNQVLNKTIVYTYDKGGNLTSKTEYPYTTGTPVTATKAYSYAYGDSNWKDKLTSFDGKAITYDAIGNPLTYNGYAYTWERGRQLAGMTGNGKTISYKYNASGIRTQKIVNGVTTTYHLVGDKVTYEENGTDNIYYTYGASGHLVSMNLNGVEYYYIRNAQGDIIGIFDKTGAQVVSYTYDSWGKLISITSPVSDATKRQSYIDNVGVKNPYRYRGYRYDAETGLYYLQSRYYSPELGRFINADAIAGSIGELLSHNIFAYCANNPIVMKDPTGLRHLRADFEEVDYKEVSQFTGAAKEYVQDLSNKRNCYAFAIGQALGLNPGDLSDGVFTFKANELGQDVIDDLTAKGRGARPLKSSTDTISNNEYRIAFRTRWHPENGEREYHFMLQNSDGSWSGKPGIAPSMRFPIGTDPTVMSWDRWSQDSCGLMYVAEGDSNWCDSATYFLAITD